MRLRGPRQVGVTTIATVTGTVAMVAMVAMVVAPPAPAAAVPNEPLVATASPVPKPVPKPVSPGAGTSLPGGGVGGAGGAAAARISLTVTAKPSNIIIPLGRLALVSGMVKGTTAPRPVRIQLSYGRRWRPAGEGSTDRRGAYTLRIPSAKLGTFTYRVYAPATASTLAAAEAASVPFSVSVGQGNPRSYKLFVPAGRWNPCQVIGYRVNLAGAPPKALDDVKIAIANVARTSGLKYAYRGTTTVIPGASNAFLSPYPKDTQLVIAWVKPGTTKHLPASSNYVGYGGWLSVGYPARFGTGSYYPITQGFVVVDRTRTMPAGFGLGDPQGLQGTWGQLVMHELGHTIGLTHVSDKSQLMYPYLQYRAAAWGLGDLGGLYNLGTRLGCFPAAALPNAGLPSRYAGLLPPGAPHLAQLATLAGQLHERQARPVPPPQVWAGDH